jgi:hypothetical protein
MNYIFRNVPNFKYLGKDYIYEDVKSKLNSDILAAIPFRTFFFHILRVNVIIKVYKTLILNAVLYGCVTRSVTIRAKKN